MSKRTDIVFINPGDAKQVYQGLRSELIAIEPPYWITVLAAYLRNKNFSVKIIDANAEDLSPEQTANIVKEINPTLSVVYVYGSQPSASTQNMTIAGKICQALKDNTQSKITLGGLHPSALPERTLKEEKVDFVIEGEGFFTLERLLEALKSGEKKYQDVPGLWYWEDKRRIVNNPRPKLVRNLDEVMLTAAWDLLPMEKYKAHNWHCFVDIDNRSPYAALYTSLGCPYSCSFCCINALFGKRGIRYRSPEAVINEISLLAEKYKVKNIKLIDELFVLDESHYMKIIDLLLDKKYDLNFWAYARLDTLNFDNLPKMKKAGINWLALGIESSNELVRKGVNKQQGKKDIKEIVKKIQSQGIAVAANYIFGLPDDDLETMQETLDFAMDLNTEWANFYCTMAYPGSKLYDTAIREGWKLPTRWQDYSQHSYDSLPLSTKYLSVKEVLLFRDTAFHRYFENPAYLEMIRQKFGVKAVEHIKRMTKTRLKRRLFEESKT